MTAEGAICCQQVKDLMYQGGQAAGGSYHTEC